MWDPPHRKGSYTNREESLQPSISSTYKETELSEKLNDGMEWVFRDYGIPSKKEKVPLPPRDDMMEFDVRNNTKNVRE